ncbi:hypothetical protein [uncultured Parvimonas sp.]|uniref:hypothetical protein n=1 Tax=uncultured Parvimonas sp. TaxID=747372 RepID=UPI002594757A|nr:hypothetical protein [uncultured Parvimonas sp.]
MEKSNLNILKYIYDFVVIDKYILYEIFKYKNTKSAYNKLLYLEKNNLIKGKNIFVNYNKIYTTTRKANRLLNFDTKEYTIKNSYNVLHELFLSYIIIYLVKKHNYSYDDFIPNRISKTYWSEHIPDLLVKKENQIIYIEYERTEKTIDRLENNAIKNNLSCDYHIWICETKYIYNRLMKAKEEFNLNIKCLMKKEITDYLKKECKDENYRLYF